MTMSDKEFLDQVKRILKRIPGTHGLIRIRNHIIQIRELSDLIRENKIVVFPQYSKMGNEIELTREMVQELVKERLDLYGIVYLRKKTAAAIDAPTGAVMLYSTQALLRIPSTHEEFLQLVGHDTRKNIRRAERQGYEYKEFIWNDHLDEIYGINTSKEERQSVPMRGWYRKPVQPRHHCEEEIQYRKYYGAFKEGKIYAYLHFWVIGDIAILKHIIGHVDHLKYGMMNGLISYAVRECIGNPQIRWLEYGTYDKSSLSEFKRRTGFQRYAMLFDLGGEQELFRYSKHKVRTIWRL